MLLAPTVIATTVHNVASRKNEEEVFFVPQRMLENPSRDDGNGAKKGSVDFQRPPNTEIEVSLLFSPERKARKAAAGQADCWAD